MLPTPSSVRFLLPLVVAVATVSACSAAPVLQAPATRTAPVSAARSGLTVTSELAPLRSLLARRQLQGLGFHTPNVITQARLSVSYYDVLSHAVISVPGTAVPFAVTGIVDTTPASVTVPAGVNRVFTLQALDASGTHVVASIMTVAAVAADTPTLRYDAVSDAAGRVVNALASGLTAGSAAETLLTGTDLSASLSTYLRTLTGYSVATNQYTSLDPQAVNVNYLAGKLASAGVGVLSQAADAPMTQPTWGKGQLKLFALDGVTPLSATLDQPGTITVQVCDPSLATASVTGTANVIDLDRVVPGDWDVMIQDSIGSTLSWGKLHVDSAGFANLNETASLGAAVTAAGTQTSQTPLAFAIDPVHQQAFTVWATQLSSYNPGGMPPTNTVYTLSGQLVSTATGAPIGGVVPIATVTGNASGSFGAGPFSTTAAAPALNVVYNPAVDEFLAVWGSDESDDSAHSGGAQRVSRLGGGAQPTSVGTPFALNVAPGPVVFCGAGIGLAPQVAVDPVGGDYALVWPAGGTGVFAEILAPQSGNFTASAPLQVSSTPAATANQSVTFNAGEGDFLVGLGGTSQTLQRIKAGGSAGSPTCTPFGLLVTVDSAAGGQTPPVIIAHADGSCLYAWTSANNYLAFLQSSTTATLTARQVDSFAANATDTPTNNASVVLTTQAAGLGVGEYSSFAGAYVPATATVAAHDTLVYKNFNDNSLDALRVFKGNLSGQSAVQFDNLHAVSSGTSGASVGVVGVDVGAATATNRCFIAPAPLTFQLQAQPLL